MPSGRECKRVLPRRAKARLLSEGKLYGFLIKHPTRENEAASPRFFHLHPLAVLTICADFLNRAGPQGSTHSLRVFQRAWVGFHLATFLGHPLLSI